MQHTGEQTGRTMADQVAAVLAGRPVRKIQHLAQPCIEPGETDGPLGGAGTGTAAGTAAPPKRRSRAKAALSSHEK